MRTNMGNAAYGLLGAPLAMAALPLFVQLPAYYATHLGIALAPLGGVLFAARLLDMLQDPLLGHLLDRTQARRKQWMALGAAVLALAFAALWLPPSSVSPGLWLALMLVPAYGAHSLVNIAYLAWGAHVPRPLGAAAWREGLGLAGMLAASLIPAAILAGDPAQLRARLAIYCTAYGLQLALAMLVLLRHAPPSAPPAMDQGQRGWRDTVRELARNRAVRALLLPYFLNALAVAIPATLALFYIADQLGAPQWSGAFLACYFGAAACGLPAWAALARRRGALRCWRLGMLLSVAGFAGAALLGPGDLLAYGVVCVAAGAALGADLALPPVLLGQSLGTRLGAGAGFGLFTLLGKLALAIAGLALPLLAWLGYSPGAGSTGEADGHAGLVFVYAVLPCLLKLSAVAALARCVPAAPESAPATTGSPS